jgi:hypothetical protein
MVVDGSTMDVDKSMDVLDSFSSLKNVSIAYQTLPSLLMNGLNGFLDP